jgi:hypothetical protein
MILRPMKKEGKRSDIEIPQSLLCALEVGSWKSVQQQIEDLSQFTI